MSALIKFRRGTRAQLDAAATALELNEGEPYFITDEDIVAVGTSASTYQEIGANLDFLSSAQDTAITDSGGATRFYFSSSNQTAIFGGAGQAGLITMYRDDAFTDMIASFGSGVTFLKTTAVNAEFFRVNHNSASTGLYPDGESDISYGSTNSFTVRRHLGSGSYSNVFILDAAGDAEFTGNVGIGTSNPTAKLDVANTSDGAGNSVPTIQIKDLFAGAWTVDSDIGRFDIYSADTSGSGAGVKGRIALKSESATGSLTALSFQTDGGSGVGLRETMRLSWDGNVGIGTASPLYKLHVYKANATTSDDTLARFTNQDGGVRLDLENQNTANVWSLRTEASTGDFGITRVGSGNFEFRLPFGGGAYLLGGNVGIGTTTPGAKLEVVGETWTQSLRCIGDSTPSGARLSLGWSQTNAYGWIQTFGGAPLRLNPLGNSVVAGSNNDPVVTETEGTWTPVVYGTTTAGSHTYGSQAGQWKRHGDLMFVDCAVQITSYDSSMAGDVRISGLPVAASVARSGVTFSTIQVGSAVSLPAGFQQMLGYISGSEVRLQYMDTAGASQNYPAGKTGVFLLIRFSAVYPV